MSDIPMGCAVPHPPILVPEIGRESLAHISATKQAMERLAAELAAAAPETLLFVSPHSSIASDAFAIKTTPRLTGSFSMFGAGRLVFSCENDLELVEEISAAAARRRLPTARLGDRYSSFVEAERLDHGVLVPLYYIEQQLSRPIVSISVSYLDYQSHYALGAAIEEAASTLGRRTVFVASGDLSHRLLPGAPAGFDPRAKDFDLLVKDLLERGDFQGLLSVDKSLIQDAGECGFRSLLMLAGIFNGRDVESEVIAYEGPFGVGYLVATVRGGEVNPERDLLGRTVPREATELPEEGDDPAVWLAKCAVEYYVLSGKVFRPPPSMAGGLSDRSAGAFVCIKRGDRLRGCIGSIEPSEPSVSSEIVVNAIKAATLDPRFDPIGAGELADLAYSVDILGPAEKIDGAADLEPSLYGVIVRCRGRTGLLLPDLDGVDTAEQQVEIARAKAGICPDEPVELFRFKVERHI